MLLSGPNFRPRHEGASGTSELYTLFAVLFAMMTAMHQWRRMRAHGARIEWAKTIISALSVILVTVVSLGAFIYCLRFGDVAGLVAFAGAETVGLGMVINAINSHWQRPGMD